MCSRSRVSSLVRIRPPPVMAAWQVGGRRLASGPALRASGGGGSLRAFLQLLFVSSYYLHEAGQKYRCTLINYFDVTFYVRPDDEYSGRQSERD